MNLLSVSLEILPKEHLPPDNQLIIPWSIFYPDWSKKLWIMPNYSKNLYLLIKYGNRWSSFLKILEVKLLTVLPPERSCKRLILNMEEKNMTASILMVSLLEYRSHFMMVRLLIVDLLCILQDMLEILLVILKPFWLISSIFWESKLLLLELLLSIYYLLYSF